MRLAWRRAIERRVSSDKEVVDVKDVEIIYV
jgi:hypothetical protein